MVFVVVAVCVLLVWLVFRRFRTDPTFVSPVPGLGCALAFKNDPVKFLCDVARNSSSFGAVTLNMAGLHLRWLLDADEARLFYKAKEDQMSSFGALHKIGFAKTLGSLNVNVGGSLHASKLRGSSVQTSINNMMVHRCLHLMEEHKSKSLELYKFCRELVLSVMVEFFVGPQRPGFHERYLQFQRAHESAIAIAMSIGKTLAWPWLRSAEQKRLRLISEIELTSEYALGLGDEFCKAQKADLCIGLLTAATKNVAIGSADAIVFCLQHRKDEISIPHAVLETLRMTCLTFGALRMAMRDGALWKKGDIVTVSHLLQARTAFENPHEWNPNRENLDVGFCFGAGVHACPGKSIALASMTSIVSTLLPRIAHIECVSPLMFDRPSLADREFCVVKLK